MTKATHARFDGTAARQLAFDDFDAGHERRPLRARLDDARPATTLRLMQKDVYAELTRRRRRAQIAARKWL